MDFRRTVALGTVLAALATGCSAADTVPASTLQVALWRLDTPVREPVWSKEARAVVALSETEPRIVKFPTSASSGRSTARTTLSDPLPGMGDNLAPSATGKKVVYAPLPAADRVAVINAGTLRVEGSLRAGKAPSFVTVDSGSDVLLALSEDGSTVTGVNVQPDPDEDPAVVTRNEVRLGPAGEVDGPARGRLIEFHTVGPNLISHYKGAVDEVKKTADIAFRAETATGGLIKVSRLYAAEKGTDRLVAIDVAPGGDKLLVVAQSRLESRCCTWESTRTGLYAATDD